MRRADSQAAWQRQAPEPKAPRGALGKGVLQVSCPADCGLVTQLVGFVQSEGGHIVGVDRHLDQDTRLSFSRIEWGLSRFGLAPEEVEHAFRKVACSDGATWRVVRTTHRDSVADLISKGQDLERVVLARAVRLHLDNRIGVCGQKTVIFGSVRRG